MSESEPEQLEWPWNIKIADATTNKVIWKHWSDTPTESEPEAKADTHLMCGRCGGCTDTTSKCDECEKAPICQRCVKRLGAKCAECVGA